MLVLEMVDEEKANDELLKKHRCFSLTVNNYSFPPAAKGESECTTSLANRL